MSTDARSDAPRDAYLDLPLSGVRLIQASAGTGKTFTLATLVTRLVVERGLRIGEILTVTFTEAATQELRKRIRERLQLALDLVEGSVVEGSMGEGSVGDDDDADVVLTRQLLQAHRDHGDESDDALRRRLRQATLEIDLAAIFTIHGFCARVLREHALESGQGFDAPELLANDRELREALAADLWRAHATDDATVDDLAALWSAGHPALAGDLPDLLREPVLLPPAPADSAIDAAQARLAEARSELQAAWRAHGEDFFDAVAAAVDSDVLNRGSYKHDWLAGLRDWFRTFSTSTAPTQEQHPKLEKMTVEQLVKGTKKGHVGKTPSSPMTATLAAYLDAQAAVEAAKARRRAALLHRIRDDARLRLATLKRQRRVQTYDDLIDGVADALDGPNGNLLAQRLRAQYAVALVDEFQDTDARQWAIFDRVFGSGSDNPALFLIGDPKQAIYGFRGGDVHAYLKAGDTAAAAPPLARNFRSRPSVLAAIDALYHGAQAAFEDKDNKQVDKPPFVDARIKFQPVVAGGKRDDDNFLRDDQPAPALTLWQAPESGDVNAKGQPKSHSAPRSRDIATQACVAAIHRVLSDARDGRASIDGQPVQPGDIAVLVRTHHEATRIQQALALVGIAAVAAGRMSLFETAEARELHTLLLALLHTGDDARLRAALSTVLVGVDAAGIDALEHPRDDSDGNAHRDWQQRALSWRERLLRGGPLALVGDLCATGADRLLGLLDGERRVSNYLQLAEQLQEAQDRALGLHGLVDWLARRIATADRGDDTQLLRLESDARRVQIVTLHKSKGLEYPLVYLPFVGIGRQSKSPSSHCVVHDPDHGRRLHWKVVPPEADWDAAKKTWQDEDRAENARLLYVGLTRAEHALWIASGPLYQYDKAPLSAMLSDASLLTAAGVVFDTTAPPDALPRLPPESDAAVPPARIATRRLASDWWVYSFSQLSRADAGDTLAASTVPASGGNDETDAIGADAPATQTDDTTFDPRFAGTRYGVALHAALECIALESSAFNTSDTDPTAFASWRDWRPGDDAPADHTTVIADALRAEGYGADVLDDGIALTTQLIGHTLTVTLPEGTRLSDLPADARRPEIEFQFSLQPTRVDMLLRLLHDHDIVRERHGFGLRQRLEGLMIGLIDLTYRHDGKWYVLDYKSNRLPGYDAAQLVEAMAHGEYDLQALIYTLALHRWLRFRLGGDYDYARDFGGIRYVFCRGLDANSQASPGIHAQRFTPELIHALDALFGHGDADGKPLSPRGEEARSRATGSCATERSSDKRSGRGAGWGEGMSEPKESRP